MLARRLLAATSVALLGMSACSSGTDDPAVFTFADDDLCQWVTEDEVAEFVAAEFDWEGTVKKVSQRAEGCEWKLLSLDGTIDDGYVLAGDASAWTDFDGNPIDLGAWEVVPYAETGTDGPLIGAGMSNHPDLSEGVVVLNAGFGQFAIWVPPINEYLYMEMAVPGYQPEADFFPRFLGVLDRFANELNWLPEQQ